MTVRTPDRLGIAVIATGRAGEPELIVPVGALRQAGARVKLPSIKPGQIEPVQHDLQPTLTFAADKRLDQADPEDYDALLLPGSAGSRPSGDIAAFTREMVNLFAAAQGA